MIALVIICLCFNVAMFIALGFVCVVCCIEVKAQENMKSRQIKEYRELEKCWNKVFKSFLEKYDVNHQSQKYEVDYVQLTHDNINIRLFDELGFYKTVGLDDVVLIENQ